MGDRLVESSFAYRMIASVEPKPSSIDDRSQDYDQKSRSGFTNMLVFNMYRRRNHCVNLSFSTSLVNMCKMYWASLFLLIVKCLARHLLSPQALMHT